jgi:hypothetical protein
MNSTLTAAVALLASSAGAVGLTGTAVAAPAPKLSVGTGVVHNGAADTLRTVTKPVGGVVSATEGLTGKSADRAGQGNGGLLGGNSLQATSVIKPALDSGTSDLGLGGGSDPSSGNSGGNGAPLSLQDGNPLNILPSGGNPVGDRLLTSNGSSPANPLGDLVSPALGSSAN